MIGYGFWSLALARVTVQLGLTPPLAALGAVLFALDQSVISREWMVGTVEPKTFAYAAALLAYACWRERRWGLSGFWSGLACSFHILVGGYALIALAGLALWHGRGHWRAAPLLSWCAAALVAASAVLFPLMEQLLGPSRDAGSELVMGKGLPSTAWIYVVLRNPHHLIPSTWSAEAWWHGLWFVLLFVGASLLCQRAGQSRAGFPLAACRDLTVWVMAGALVALLGLLISLLDHQGVLLRFYLFRFADTTVALGSWLLLLCWLPRRAQRWWPMAALVLLVVVNGGRNALEARANLAAGFIDSAERSELYSWLRRLPDPGAVVLTPPSGFEDLALQTRHPNFAQFKQVPTAPIAIRSWYLRMTALAGGDVQVWQGPGGWPARRRLMQAYDRLDAGALAQLASDEQLGVVITAAGRPGPRGWRQGFGNSQWAAWLPAPKAASGHAGATRSHPRPWRPYPLPSPRATSKPPPSSTPASCASRSTGWSCRWGWWAASA